MDKFYSSGVISCVYINQSVDKSMLVVLEIFQSASFPICIDEIVVVKRVDTALGMSCHSSVVTSQGT